VLNVTAAARSLLAERGWDPVYGARPLKRAIQRLVQDPLAMQLLEGRFGEGDTVEVDAKAGDLTFTKPAQSAQSVA
jgi:ATP-dependent Clp protease ATP-binding subunit ClpA